VTEKSTPESYYAGAYWGPRREPPEACAQRASAFLNLLAPSDPFLAHWYKPARSRKDARKHPLMPLDVPTLTELFRRGVNRADGGKVIAQLGFSCWFDNGGGNYDSASLRIHCGDYSAASPNSCVLTLPRSGANAERVLTEGVLTSAVRAMVLAWAPDWAFATSYAYERQYPEPDSAPFSVGWVTYLSHRLGKVPPLPAPVRIEGIEALGTLMVLTPERFTVGNPAHVALARRVRELLAKANVSGPGIAH
jgi:hypothetical protein